LIDTMCNCTDVPRHLKLHTPMRSGNCKLLLPIRMLVRLVKRISFVSSRELSLPALWYGKKIHFFPEV